MALRSGKPGLSLRSARISGAFRICFEDDEDAYDISCHTSPPHHFYSFCEVLAFYDKFIELDTLLHVRQRCRCAAAIEHNATITLAKCICGSPANALIHLHACEEETPDPVRF
jgi:hypothetical protein